MNEDERKAAIQRRTRAATAASIRVRRRKHEERLATELRQRGWTCTPPTEQDTQQTA